MRRPASCLLIIAAMTLVSCDGGSPQPLAVSLDFELHTPEDAPPHVTGTSNLPVGTILEVNLDEQRPGGTTHAASCFVDDDGTFQTPPLKEEGPALPGAYLVSIVMPVALQQPDEVRRQIGPQGELLDGPLVERGAFGAVVRSEKEVRIGGTDALRLQKDRAAETVRELEAVLDEIEAEHREMNEVADNLDTEIAPPRNPVWLTFAAEIQPRLQAIDERLVAIETGTNAIAVRHAFESVLRTYEFVTRVNRDAYQTEKRQFVTSRDRARQLLADIRDFAELPPRPAEEIGKRPPPRSRHAPRSARSPASPRGARVERGGVESSGTTAGGGGALRKAQAPVARDGGLRRVARPQTVSRSDEKPRPPIDTAAVRRR